MKVESMIGQGRKISAKQFYFQEQTRDVRLHLRKAAILLIVGFSCSVASTGQNVKTIYNFLGGSDGAYPNGGIVRTSDGFYGTTSSGGTFNNGTVYKLTEPTNEGASWTESILYNFTGGSDGAFPFSAPIIDKNGVIYGITSLGGQLGKGAVYSLTPPQVPGGTWSETVLYSFIGGKDGEVPESALVFDPSGNLYGSTVNGGGGGIGVCASNTGCGTVYRLTPPSNPGDPWTEHVLYRFQGGTDGGLPGGVTLDRSGALYGTTDLGGANRVGVVYKLKQRIPGGPWKHAVIYDFVTGDPYFFTPQVQLTLNRSGVIYGPRYKGGDYSFGFIFQLAPPSMPGGTWTFSQLFSFTGSYDGLSPDAGVTLDSTTTTIYGTTGVGGRFGSGVVFKLTPGNPGNPWNETLLHTFAGPDGRNPYSPPLIDKAGYIYGITSGGGQTNLGTVFKLKP
jgi:hypothetical protein